MSKFTIGKKWKRQAIILGKSRPEKQEKKGEPVISVKARISTRENPPQKIQFCKCM